MESNINFINIEYIFSRIVDFFVQLFGGASTSNDSVGRVGETAASIGNTLTFIVGIIVPLITIFLILFLTYILIKIKDLKKREQKKLLARIYQRQQEDLAQPKTSRWGNIVELFESDKESDWRMAIIEADAILEEFITQLGYTGDTFGEKLKNIDPGNFPALQQAWDVHLIRNKIAHEGMEFKLEAFEKNRVYRIYENILSQGGFI